VIFFSSFFSSFSSLISFSHFFFFFFLRSRLATQKGLAQHPEKQRRRLPASLLEAQTDRTHEGGLQRNQGVAQAEEGMRAAP